MAGQAQLTISSRRSVTTIPIPLIMDIIMCTRFPEVEADEVIALRLGNLQRRREMERREIANHHYIQDSN